jgi:hypothetical protein
MRKDTALSFRIPKPLKTELERVAVMEGRSLSQICEMFLTVGFDAYKKNGTKLMKQYFLRRKAEQPDP